MFGASGRPPWFPALTIGPANTPRAGLGSQTINSRDGSAAQRIALTILNGNAAGTGVNPISTQMTDNVGNVATVILASPSRSTLCLISGSSGGNLFSDILNVTPNSFAVINSLTDAGAPPARNYSVAAFALRLAMGAVPPPFWNINVLAFGADMRN